MISYFNNIQQQNPPQRKSNLLRSNTLATSTSASMEARSNVLIRRALYANSNTVSNQTPTSQQVNESRSLRMRHADQVHTTPHTITQSINDTNDNAGTPDSTANSLNAPESPTASIAKSVKLRPRQSIKRSRDAPLIHQSKYEQNSSKINENEATGVQSASAVAAATTEVDIKKYRYDFRRKIDVDSPNVPVTSSSSSFKNHRHSIIQLDSSSNSSTASDTSIDSAISSHSMRTRRK